MQSECAVDSLRIEGIMDFRALDESYTEILNGNDVNALKNALQNLMVLFETQNRGYCDLREQLKALKLAKRGLVIEKTVEMTVEGENSRPQCEGIVDEAFELLAAVRSARKAQIEACDTAVQNLKSVLEEEKDKRRQIWKIHQKRKSET
jgi:hypothetical protein